MDDYTLKKSFAAVCNNETFSSYKEMEPYLTIAANGIISGWRPEIVEMSGLSAQRAGYLVDILRGWTSSELSLSWDNDLNFLRKKLGDNLVSAPFFHGDLIRSTHDEFAIHWGLIKGVDLPKLKRLMKANESDSAP